jgi:urease accessory protein
VQAALPAAVALVAAFGLLHGHAHGAELPEAADPLAYGLGFVAATVALHGVGIALGTVARVPWGAALIRTGGLATAVIGVILLAS